MRRTLRVESVWRASSVQPLSDALRLAIDTVPSAYSAASIKPKVLLKLSIFMPSKYLSPLRCSPSGSKSNAKYPRFNPAVSISERSSFQMSAVSPLAAYILCFCASSAALLCSCGAFAISAVSSLLSSCRRIITFLCTVL